MMVSERTIIFLGKTHKLKLIFDALRLHGQYDYAGLSIEQGDECVYAGLHGPLTVFGLDQTSAVNVFDAVTDLERNVLHCVHLVNEAAGIVLAPRCE